MSTTNGGNRKGFGSHITPLPRGFKKILSAEVNLKNGGNGTLKVIVFAANFNKKQLRTIKGSTICLKHISKYEQSYWENLFNEMTLTSKELEKLAKKNQA